MATFGLVEYLVIKTAHVMTPNWQYPACSNSLTIRVVRLDERRKGVGGRDRHAANGPTKAQKPKTSTLQA